jgi:proteic killer suppression protein
MAIRSFKDQRLDAILNGRRTPKGFPTNLAKVTRRKLVQIDAAARLDDLRVPPANELEALKGDRSGQYSNRVNDPFRLCFVWTDQGPSEVEFVDYH